MSQAALMRSRRFAPLFWCQFLGALNDNVFRFALIIFVTFTLAERTGADTRMLVVLTGGVFIVPFFLFSALAGQIADKFEKSNLIRQIKTCEIIVMGLGAVGFLLGNYYFLLAVLFTMGAQSAFFGPLKYAILPQHLRADELTGGNGLIQMGTYIAILSGALIGGLLASLGALAPQAIIASVVALAVVGRVCAHYIPRASASDAALVVDLNPLSSTWSLLAESTRDRGIFVLILLISMFWFIGATYLSVVPTYGKVLLNADERAVTLLTAAFTVGIGIGSLSCERLSRGRIELGLVPLAALGISLASFDVWLAGAPQTPQTQLTPSGFFANPAALRMFVDLVVIGAMGALYIVPLYAALQQRVAAEYRSRMLAALNVTSALFMVASAGFTAALFQRDVTIFGIFAIVATINVSTILCAVIAVPEFLERLKALFRSAQ